MAHASDTPLDYRTAVTQVERALVERLSLAYQERLPPAADLADLRQRAMPGVMDRDLCFVQSRGRVFRWLDIEGEPDDNASCIAPVNWLDDAGLTKRGRWIEQTDDTLYATRDYVHAIPLCAIPTGYARSVQLYQGRVTTQDAFTRIFGRRPAILVRYMGDRRRKHSLSPALYRCEMDFQLIGISYSPRYGTAALQGSDLPEEAANDPGLHNILGDADDCAQGASDPATDYYHLVPGVDVTLPGTHQIVIEELGERLFVGAVSLAIVTYLHRPDRDTVPLTELAITTQHGDDRQGALDADNCVRAGLNILWPRASLFAVPEAGYATIAGKEVVAKVATVGFPANSDIYRDLNPDGSLTYQAVTAGADAPPLADGALRIGVTTTDANSVVYDQFICPTLFDVFGPDVIPTPT